MKGIIQGWLNRFGLQVKRYPDLDLQRRIKLVRHSKIEVLLDVGANGGHYGMQMRKLGYVGRIVSFEPMQDPFTILSRVAGENQPWDVIQMAMGDEEGWMDINISANSFSSSILPSLPGLKAWAPEAEYVATEKVQVVRLDDVFADHCLPGDHVMLKLDVQGYEQNALTGAKQSISKIRLLQLEMSITPLYEGELVFLEMLSKLRDMGFELYSLENGFSDDMTGRLLQADGIFVNTRIS